METAAQIRLGDDRFDSQHQILVGLLGDLKGAVLLRQARPILADCFERLRLYMAVHFAFEERLMMEAHYDEIESHRTEHEIALNTVRRLEGLFSQGQHEDVSDVAREVVTFAESWANRHIPGADAKLVNFLASQRK